MARLDPYPRQELKRLRREWRHRNAWTLMVFASLVIAILVVVTVLLVAVGTPTAFSWYLLGALHAGALVACWYAVDGSFLAHDARAIHQLRGAWGEDITRDELRRARRHIWGWVDTIQLQAGDIDHLVVTRRGGIVAIDTKWRTGTADVADAGDMARAASRARTRAEGLTRSLWKAETGARHRAKTHPLPVRSIVVVWGALQHHLPDEGAHHDGIEFVPGRKLRAWLARVDGAPVSREAGRDVLRRLNEFRDRASTAQS